MGKLRQQERIIARNEARRNGAKSPRMPDVGPWTPLVAQEEQRRLGLQNHTWIADFSPEEQAKFEAERQQMWSKIPEHLRGKAEQLIMGK